MRGRKSFAAALGLAGLLLVALMAPSGAQADFGIKEMSAETLREGGAVDLRAGSSPYEFKLGLEMNLDSEGRPEGTLSQVVVDLPAGMVGNPLAVPRCPAADFEGQQALCPGNTQIGIAHLNLVGYEGNQPVSPVYNLTPPFGVAASIGFSVANQNSFQEASLRTGGDYGVRASDITIPTTNIEIQSLTETIWGVPAMASHDPERSCLVNGAFQFGCANEMSPAAFLTLPTSCGVPLKTTLTVGSVEEPGVTQSASVQSLGEAGTAEGLYACDRPQFRPTISAQPETVQADSPTGLHFNLHIPQNDDPEGIATAHLKATALTLPGGLAVNPSSATGLGACSPAQIDLHGTGPANCPANSKLGTVSIKTPVLDHPVTGSVYLATQGDNPFGSLIALYIAVHDPITGIIVKLAGKVEPDPVSGQLKATFQDNPQLPFEDLDVDFTGGPRAALTTPLTCGSYTTSSTLTPWTAPEGAGAFPSSSFQITSGANGGPCVGSEATTPNRPSLEAGTLTPIAGVYSPFSFKLSRENGSQRIASIDTTLPKGLTGKLAGIPYCSEAQIAAAGARTNPGQGAIERASLSCSPASEVGTVNVGAGSGSPFYVQGHAYLAGPYKGAPLSLAIITPAVAGPFDLGVVLVRTALYVSETTAQIRAISDPIPSILYGIPLDVRSIALNMNRPDFTLNPTNCNAMAVLGSTVSTLGQSAPVSNRFQVGACGALGFRPKVALSLEGGTRRTKHPKLKALVTYPKGAYSNIARASVTLPRSEFIDPERVANPCTRPQFNEGNCPKDSVLGTAKVFTPLLDKPLTGKVYFRANGGERELPDIVVDLKGQVHVVLVGRVDAVVKKGTEISRIRNTFATVPDAPVSKFVLELKGGKEGLLVNSENLCTTKRRATVKLTAQNARVHDSNPLIATSCGR